MPNKKRVIIITVMLFSIFVLGTAVSNAQNGRQSPSNHHHKQPASFNLSTELFLPLLYKPFPPGTFLGKIAFSSYRTGTTFAEMFLINPDGTGLTPLIQDNYNNGGAVWSPDNSQIVFTKVTHDYLTSEIYKMSADGSNQVRLTNNNFADGAADWSPDGSKILFVSRRDSNGSDIFVMNANGCGETQLTHAIYTAHSPTISPTTTSAQAGQTKKSPYQDLVPEGSGNRPIPAKLIMTPRPIA